MQGRLNHRCLQICSWTKCPANCRRLWFYLPEEEAIWCGHFLSETINYDVCTMRRYIRNILQWEEKSKECMKIPTGDYSTCLARRNRVLSWANKGKVKILGTVRIRIRMDSKMAAILEACYLKTWTYLVIRRQGMLITYNFLWTYLGSQFWNIFKNI